MFLTKLLFPFWSISKLNSAYIKPLFGFQAWLFVTLAGLRELKYRNILTIRAATMFCKFYNPILYKGSAFCQIFFFFLGGGAGRGVFLKFYVNILLSTEIFFVFLCFNYNSILIIIKKLFIFKSFWQVQ